MIKKTIYKHSIRELIGSNNPMYMIGGYLVIVLHAGLMASTFVTVRYCLEVCFSVFKP